MQATISTVFVEISCDQRWTGANPYYQPEGVLIHLIASIAVGMVTLVAAALWITQTIRMLAASAIISLCSLFYWIYTISPIGALVAFMIILIVFSSLLRNDPEAD